MRVRARRLLGWALVVSLCSAADLAAADAPTLLQAVKNQDRDAVRLLLEKHADVNAKQPDGSTALHWATYWDAADTVNLLIAAGATVNVANELGVTPLYLACENGNATLVERFLAGGTPANTALPSGETALMTAARSGSTAAVKTLIAHGADVNAREKSEGQTALMWAVAEKHPEVTDVLIKAGAQVNARSNSRATPTLPLGLVQEGGYTPFLFAARSGDIASARLLLAAGADVNDMAPLGTSALVVASHSGNTEFGLFLLEKGANPNAAGAGYAALHTAIVRDDLTLAKALLARGADPNARFTKGSKSGRQAKLWEVPGELAGSTAFFLAAKLAEFDIMRALVDARADPKPGLGVGGDRIDPDAPVAGPRRGSNAGTTPLMVAAGLLTGGFGRGGTDRQGREMDAAEQEAARAQNPDTRKILNSGLDAVKLCVELGADVNAVNYNGDTALHAAAHHGFTSVVQYLVDHGARMEAKNKRGQTPLMVAMDTQDGDGEPAAVLLRKLGATE